MPRITRFHFELSWPSFDDYDDSVQQGWARRVLQMDPLMRLDFMLRHLVQSWSAARIGDIKAQLLVAQELVLRLDVAQEHRQLSAVEARQRSRIRQLSDRRIPQHSPSSIFGQSSGLHTNLAKCSVTPIYLWGEEALLDFISILDCAELLDQIPGSPAKHKGNF